MKKPGKGEAPNTSVIRFGEIPLLWRIFKNLFKVCLALDKIFNSLWYNLLAFGQIFIAVNGQILKTQSGHSAKYFDDVCSLVYISTLRNSFFSL